eukprot:GHVU01025461.1.p5 GENE.GHVU01025461.1~~GHVU01025461.1.p5  ORF type:complete len:123 (+),score=12.22 GHVU01025461.1:737-1105(+)
MLYELFSNKNAATLVEGLPVLVAGNKSELPGARLEKTLREDIERQMYVRTYGSVCVRDPPRVCVCVCVRVGFRVCVYACPFAWVVHSGLYVCGPQRSVVIHLLPRRRASERASERCDWNVEC